MHKETALDITIKTQHYIRFSPYYKKKNIHEIIETKTTDKIITENIDFSYLLSNYCLFIIMTVNAHRYRICRYNSTISGLTYYYKIHRTTFVLISLWCRSDVGCNIILYSTIEIKNMLRVQWNHYHFFFFLVRILWIKIRCNGNRRGYHSKLRMFKKKMQFFSSKMIILYTIKRRIVYEKRNQRWKSNYILFIRILFEILSASNVWISKIIFHE